MHPGHEASSPPPARATEPRITCHRFSASGLEVEACLQLRALLYRFLDHLSREMAPTKAIRAAADRPRTPCPPRRPADIALELTCLPINRFGCANSPSSARAAFSAYDVQVFLAGRQGAHGTPAGSRLLRSRRARLRAPLPCVPPARSLRQCRRPDAWSARARARTRGDRPARARSGSASSSAPSAPACATRGHHLRVRSQ